MEIAQVLPVCHNVHYVMEVCIVVLMVFMRFLHRNVVQDIIVRMVQEHIRELLEDLVVVEVCVLQGSTALQAQAFLFCALQEP